ncbi:centriolar and ciliogenesis-associated protein HYLS1 [Cololabis saira]|uniref:centriolar and ciliogenesis-associated protein HYLS1 n=1 Tax=Cololabis saira TaxID=129043 RepID=UPI002AD33735|nr:centriolar and ciliogenesis-associated protein HYLS1 [Cololabis saira]
MDNLDFSEDEIQEQLAVLGYKNISKHRLLEFKQELDELIQNGQWKSLAPVTQVNGRSPMADSQPSPPAYTKEKVSQCYFGSGERFFLHTDNANHDKQVLPAHENRNRLWQQGRWDSYAQHSVAPKLQLPAGAPRRLQEVSDPEDSLDSARSDSCTSGPDIQQQQRFIKRKVLRKHQGQSLVCDESVYTDDSDAASCLEERLAGLNLSTSPQREFEEQTDVSSDRSSRSDRSDDMSLSAFESYIGRMIRTRGDRDLRPKPKSFIRPVMSQQTIKKTDPVAKYFQYKQLWEMFKLPGEKDRRSLRWEIKERLAYQPPPPKPRRALVPNTYVVPTEKKRSALRWEVRNDLASGFLPHKLGCQF